MAMVGITSKDRTGDTIVKKYCTPTYELDEE